MKYPIDSVKLIDLPLVPERRGNLTFVEGDVHIPFAIKRVYYLYDIPSGAERGQHAHKELQQLIICMSGSFSIVIDDGNSTKEFFMDSPSKGLYLPPMIWRDIKSFSKGSVCMVLASEVYLESDYIRNYSTFILQAQSSSL